MRWTSKAAQVGSCGRIRGLACGAQALRSGPLRSKFFSAEGLRPFAAAPATSFLVSPADSRGSRSGLDIRGHPRDPHPESLRELLDARPNEVFKSKTRSPHTTLTERNSSGVKG
jgi:hypothetical protein